MRYYKKMIGEQLAYLRATESEDNGPGVVEISETEYKSLGGIIPHPVQPFEPVIDPITETQLAVAELAQVVEDNNTATQLALAELAGIVLGG